MTTASRRLTDRLTAATIATYAVVVFGATLTSQGGAGAWFDGEPPVLALGHGVAAALAALFLGLAAWTALHVQISGRLRVLLGATGALFPIQAAVGGAIAVGIAPGLAQLHLLLAIGIFGLLLGALVLALEETIEVADAGAVDATEPDPAEPDPVASGQRNTGPLATARAYLRLTKPRLMWLLCLLSLGGIGTSEWSGPPTDRSRWG